MKSYKQGDIVIVRKKFPNWYMNWTTKMDDYIGKESIVMEDCGIHNNETAIALLLKSEYDYNVKNGLHNGISLSYVFPIASLDNRLEKLKRILDDE